MLEYAQVLKRYGGDRVQLQCYDGVSRQGVIRGSLWKRVWINVVSDGIYASFVHA